MLELPQWRSYVEALDQRLLFVTVSGAHLYGFESPDSDIDLRGCHLLPLREVIGLHMPNQTIERSGIHNGTEVDLVSHDAGKYLNLLVRNNGYVLEQIFSPLVVLGQDFLDELRPIARRCITKHHYHHYRGFFATQFKLLEKQEPKTAKALLYAYRVLLTGIHLLDTGEVEANLRNLNERFKLSWIDALIASKTQEFVAPDDLDWSFHKQQLSVLEQRLDQAYARSPLSEQRDIAAVDELLVRLRLESQGSP